MNELERTNEIMPVMQSATIDDYKMREGSRVINFARTIFDVDKESPHYKDKKEFLNPANQVTTAVNAQTKNMAKNRYFEQLAPWYKPYQYSSQTNQTDKTLEDDVLIFESRFESGNLKEAI